MDLVLHLQDKMASNETYKKVFDKVWGASGKCLTATSKTNKISYHDLTHTKVL